VAGQALVAAGRTVADDVAVHSLHAYFLRPGDPKVPIIYEVDRIRDGRSFTTRRTIAIQHGFPIFHLSASFHRAEDGYEHQAAMPDVAGPDDLPYLAEWDAGIRERMPAMLEREWPVEVRRVDRPPWLDGRRDPYASVWIKANGRLPDDPLLHTCIVTYASDYTLLDVSLAVHGTSWFENTVMMASLDHAMWFHRSFRADEWLLYTQHSPSAHSALGLSGGSIFTQDGRLVATVMQEGLIRPLRPKG
jgi:acyl-CoA thioesterase-2